MGVFKNISDASRNKGSRKSTVTVSPTEEKHNYSHFYVLLKDMPCEGMSREMLKELLVAQYTNCRTVSLKEMQYDEYRKMCAAMKVGITTSASPKEGKLTASATSLKGGAGETWRRRVLAAVGEHLERGGYLNNLDYKERLEKIKRTALRSLGGEYDDFNRIPVQRLQNVYYGFRKKNKDAGRINEMFKAEAVTLASLN